MENNAVQKVLGKTPYYELVFIITLDPVAAFIALAAAPIPSKLRLRQSADSK